MQKELWHKKSKQENNSLENNKKGRNSSINIEEFIKNR